MPRGVTAEDGAERVSVNGYHYTRVGGKWRLTHHIIAEKSLGRSIDTGRDFVRFKDGDRKNLEPGNIEVLAKNKATVRKKIAQVEARINVLVAYREGLMREINAP